ncbi:RdRP-domain-containing protein [Hypoxylon sp. NC1633]|nr:RdRP-domain-containing protein [Hypoxylon sp. NC1633]
MEGLEVYIGNLQPDLTDHGLKTQLKPFITDGLVITDWACQKARGRSWGTVTFLHKIQGEKFLTIHGEQIIPGLYRNGKPQSRARLTILGKAAYCKRSTKLPDPFLLRTLVKTAEDLAQHRKEREEQPLPSDRNVFFDLLGLSCGHYEYPNGNLAYAADIDWPAIGLAKFARDKLILTFKTKATSIRMEVPYRTVHEVVVTGRPTSLTLTLWEVPRFYSNGNAQGIASLFSQLGISQPGIANNYTTGQNNSPRERLTQLPHSSGNHGEILGQSLVYSLHLSPSDFNAKFQKLKGKERLEFSYHEFPNVWLGRTYMADGMKAFRAQLDEYGATAIVPFDVLFQFQALAQNGYLLPQTVEALLRRLCQTARSPVKQNARQPLALSAGAVKKLFSQIPFPGPNVEASTFSVDEIWSYLENNEKEIRLGIAKELISERARQNLVMVYKVQVTPTRMTLLGPEPEAKNRILRKFPDHIGHFARVQFCEEDGQDIFFNAKVDLKSIWGRFKSVLLRGIIIAGRAYNFLGFSHSSLRAHGVWFMAPFVDQNSRLQTYFSVISDLGKFNKIFSPPRCAARIGQAFSETPFSVDLQDLEVEVQYIKDVKSRDGTRVFSDGVGTLSRSLMEDIQAALPRNRGSTTCFQIRWGGAKGMLSLDDTLDGKIMRIRPESMLKFESEDTRYLEICDMGNKPIPLVLNRQMIKILEDMGVSGEWFFQVQNRELDRLRMITGHVHNTIVFLKRQKVAEPISFSKFIRRLSKLGIDYRQDEFLCSVVEAVVLKEVRLLKHKARIPVEKGVTLFGVMDEFAFLEEGEIYVTFDQKKLAGTQEWDLRDREVIVTRSPALHPGDIQVRRAVVPPPHHPLRSLTNCVVFSQKGPRDLPSQLSGGDLDGDIYNIICDDFAVDSLKREFQPADYPRVNPLNIGREVTREDMTEFFVEFMATDQLGVIATKHMILADMKAAGTVDKECQLLAELHSTGVDYSKSGIPIDINKMKGLTPTRYRPDFLAPAPPANIVGRSEIVLETQVPALLVDEDEDEDSGPSHRYYGSEKILGKLYQAIDEKKIWRKHIHQPVIRRGASVWDQLLVFIKKQCEELGGVDWQPALDEGRRIRQAYDDAIWSATMDYSDNSTKGLTELEVFTGSIFNKSGALTRRQRDKSIRLKDEFDRIAKWVASVIRKKKLELQDDEDDGEDREYDEANDGKPPSSTSNQDTSDGISALELSIACLYVGMTKSNPFGRSNGEFLSFKVVAAQCALSELEIAIMRQEIDAGAAYMATRMR